MISEQSTWTGSTGAELECFYWKPDGPIAGIIQIVHGMAEHMARYAGAAEALTRASFMVAGITQAGHGDAAPVKGFFGREDGLETLLDDIHLFRDHLQSAYPNVPFFLLGHSMGSFLTRCYIQDHAEGLSGAILSGTGHYDKASIHMGLLLCGIYITLGRGMMPCGLVNRVTNAGMLRRIPDAQTPFDWLSADRDTVSEYNRDPLCGFMFTAYGYRDLFHALGRMSDKEGLNRIPVNLPVYLFSGEEDPVGGYGTGVRRVAQDLRGAGLQEVDMRLYKGGRHEMFNEVNAQDVCRDTAAWLYKHLA